MRTLIRAASLRLGLHHPGIGCAAVLWPVGACAFVVFVVASVVWSLFR